MYGLHFTIGTGNNKEEGMKRLLWMISGMVLGMMLLSPIIAATQKEYVFPPDTTAVKSRVYPQGISYHLARKSVV